MHFNMHVGSFLVLSAPGPSPHFPASGPGARRLKAGQGKVHHKGPGVCMGPGTREHHHQKAFPFRFGLMTQTTFGSARATSHYNAAPNSLCHSRRLGLKVFQ